MTKCALLLPGLLPLIVTCSAFVASVHGARSFSRLSTKLNANIAIFGGSGKTGSECVYQSLSAGHKPFILARDPSKLRIPVGSGGKIGGTPLYDSNIKIIAGDVTNQEAVDSVFQNNHIDGVIIALGGRTTAVGPTMLTDGTKNVINAMKKHGVGRVSVVTSIGTGDSLNQAPWSFRLLIYSVMRKSFADKNSQEQLFLSPEGPGHNLEPGGLGEGAPTGVVNVVKDEAGSIHRADLASFLLDSVTDPSFKYLHQAVAVSSSHGTGWTKQAGFDKPTGSTI